MKKDKDAIDSELFEEMRHGSEKAFKALFDSYYEALCLYSFQTTGSFHASEDLVADFFVQLWEQASTLHVTRVKPYFYSSVHHASVAWARKTNEEVDIFDIDELYDEDLSDSEESHERLRQLRASIDKLPQQEYNVLMEVVVNSKRYKEVAAEMDISINTVKTHLKRAMKALRKSARQ